MNTKPPTVLLAFLNAVPALRFLSIFVFFGPFPFFSVAVARTRIKALGLGDES